MHTSRVDVSASFDNFVFAMGRASVGLLICFTIHIASANNVSCDQKDCHIKDTTVRFYVLGDWGGDTDAPYVTKGEAACARMMNNASLRTKPHFFISTGDNFYENGITSIHDPRLKTTFDDVFLYGKETSVPWYIIAGNHDWFGNVDAQIQYSQINKRWKFPNLFYSVTYTSHEGHEGKRALVKFIFIDTIILCGNTNDEDNEDEDDDESGTDAGGRVRSPNRPKNITEAELRWTWIEQQMKDTRAQYLFIVGHYPIFAFSSHGISPCLVPRLHDMLAKYNATGYLSGHSHTLQHMTTFSPSGHVIHHVVSGAGHLMKSNYRSLDLTENPWRLQSQLFYPKIKRGHKNEKKRMKHMGGVVYVEMNNQTGTMEYYNCNGTLLYHFGFEPRPV